MKTLILLLAGILIVVFIGINYQNHKPTLKAKSWKEEQAEYEKVFAEIRKMNDDARKDREKFIDAMVDVEFSDPDNHLPRWLVKLNVEQQYNPVNSAN